MESELSDSGKPGGHQVIRFKELLGGELKNDLQGHSISSISSYKNNLYIGTSGGKLLHYHKFEDASEFMLISELDFSKDSKAITKLLVMDGIQKILILSGGVCSACNLPELTPYHIGKLKDVNDISLLSYSQSVKQGNKDSAPLSDKVLVFSSNRIAIVQVNTDQFKLLKTLNYNGAIEGVSIASSETVNYSNLVLVANNASYDLIDLKKTRKIPLFEYNPSKLPVSQVPPRIIPFNARDKDDEDEYLVSIRSDENTAMCMFFNHKGDVTRGTLSWVGYGYPKNGVVIRWPYVVSVLSFEGRSDRLVYSSLEDLSVVANNDIHTFMKNTKKGNEETKVIEEIGQEAGSSKETQTYFITEASHLEIPDDDTNSLLLRLQPRDKKLLPSSSQLLKSPFYVLEGTNIHVGYLKSDLLELYEQVKDFFEDGKEAKEDIGAKFYDFIKVGDKEVSEFINLVHILFLLFQNKVDDWLKTSTMSDGGNLVIDPHFNLLLFSEPDFTVWDDYSFPLSLEVFMNKVKGKIDKTQMLKYAFEVFDKAGGSKVALRSFIYKEEHDTNRLTNFIKTKDKQNWLEQSATNSSILKLLTDDLALINVYLIIQENDKKSYAKEICVRSLRLLKEVDKSSEIYSFLVKTISDQLKIFTDENEFTNYLIEFAKTDSSMGVKFIKDNKNSPFRASFNSILEKIPEAGDKLSLLKIELYENMFKEDMSNKDQFLKLLLELTKVILSDSIWTEENRNNFDILQNTYKIENSLSEKSWPKISWIDYINISKPRSECKEFLDLFVKVYELLLINNRLHRISLEDFKKLVPSDSAFGYLLLMANEENPILELLETHDYSSAEFFAIFDSFTFPKRLSYLSEEPKIEKIDKKLASENLKQILKFYLKKAESESEAYFALSHFTYDYGVDFFDITELLNLIPENAPLKYIQDYLTDAFAQIGIEYRQTMLQKAISKADVGTITKTYRDLAS